MGINRNTADITHNAVAKAGDTMTGALVLSPGSAGAPSISFSGDTDTGIYNSSANTIAFTVGGAAVCGISSTYISSAAAFIAPAGSASAPGYLFQGDAGTGLYSSGADNITFTTNSTARMQLNNSGLCIGDYLSAAYPLEVWKNSDGIISRFARGNGTNNPRLEVSAVDATKTLTLDATGSTTPNLEIKTGGTARMAINTTGQVGIGASPNANYALATDVNYTGAASIGMVNIGRSGGDYPSVGYNFRATNTSGSYLYNANDLSSRLEFYLGGFRFYVASSGTAGNAISYATSHTFRSDGRVGFNSSGDAGYTFTITSFSNDSSHYAFNVASTGWGSNLFSVTGAGEAHLGTSGAGLRIGTTSNFGINTRQTVYYYGVGTQYGILCRPQYDNSYPLMLLNAAGSTCGYIYTTSSATTYSTSSDYRLKESVAPMVNATERLMQLKPCTYKWKVDGSYGEGFLAHEAQEVVPIAVVGEKDQEIDGKPHYQGIDTSKMVPLLTAALQELVKENAELKNRIQALEDKQV